MKMRLSVLSILLVALVSVIGTSVAFAKASVTHDPVVTFQAAGTIGGGVLTPGDTFPPTTHGQSTFVRSKSGVKFSIQTSGLPEGAYTVWWVVFNKPENCSPGGCVEVDLLNPDVMASAFWATGGIVRENGIGNFQDKFRLGDSLGIPGDQDLIGGPGVIDPMTAEVHNIIKYHGPASDDPDTLWYQTNTILGSCFEGANAVDLGDPFGIHCFDPQVAVHLP